MELAHAQAPFWSPQILPRFFWSPPISFGLPSRATQFLESGAGWLSGVGDLWAMVRGQGWGVQLTFLALSWGTYICDM